MTFPFKSLLVCSLTILSLASHAPASQLILLQDNFNVSQGAAYTTTGAIGASPWQINRSSDDFGGRIDGGVLMLTNDASGTTNASGWVSATQSNSGFGDGFSSILGDNVKLVEWSFNLRQIRPDPSGFDSGNYGTAVVLATNSTSLGGSGVGYAVVLGQDGSTDPIRLARFNSGFILNSTVTDIIVASAPLADVGPEFTSLRVVYNPATDEWSLFGRNDGGSFTDPLTGTLSALGSATDSTHTATSLTNFGFYWQGATAATQTAQIDNFTLLITPEPGRAVLLALGTLLLVLRRRH